MLLLKSINGLFRITVILAFLQLIQCPNREVPFHSLFLLDELFVVFGTGNLFFSLVEISSQSVGSEIILLGLFFRIICVREIQSGNIAGNFWFFPADFGPDWEILSSDADPNKCSIEYARTDEIEKILRRDGRCQKRSRQGKPKFSKRKKIKQ